MTAALDVASLRDYLSSQGLLGGELVVAALSGGQSNPTFRLESGGRKLVLRKKPAGPLLASAHAIDREYRVMDALRDTGVPVPRMLAYCEDPAVLGTPFYLMEYLEGRVLLDQRLPGMTAQERRAMYLDMGRVLAALHRVDWRAAGLESYGKPGNYFARQIGRWSRQCAQVRVPLDPAMSRLMEWLPRNIPDDDATTIVHGDYRLDNLVFHADEPRVIGVLDWELSTLGHPLADLSYQCMSWHIPPSLWRGIGGEDLEGLGIPSEDEYVARYQAATGFDAAGHWNFYLAYNLFRIAAILYGIAQRAIDGTATAEDARATGEKAGPLARIGWQCAQRHIAANGTGS